MLYFMLSFFFFLMIRRPPRSTLSSSSAASDVYKRQAEGSVWDIDQDRECHEGGLAGPRSGQAVAGSEGRGLDTGSHRADATESRGDPDPGRLRGCVRRAPAKR
eukprot:TRINITY_DN45648_c0_g1_i1.p1 TRINITY_DN45648_c0_g1~~TRINITY_DN45648_c0_g1_i1.p1  ORF type:complete len:104 (+),score=26.38 TRINITY_DN45648_c0_g1_i1:36-347(+)